jgi:hypothetical protein
MEEIQLSEKFLCNWDLMQENGRKQKAIEQS